MINMIRRKMSDYIFPDSRMDLEILFLQIGLAKEDEFFNHEYGIKRL